MGRAKRRASESGGSAGDAVAGASAGGAAGASAAVLGGDRARGVQRGRGGGGRVSVGGWRPVVSGGWRHADRHARLPLSGRYLSFAEREEIALLRAAGCGVREIARQLGRSPSTISRELRRNAATRSGGLDYRATTAQWHADRRGAAAQAGQARRQRRAAALCPGPPGRRCRSGPDGVAAAAHTSVDRPASRVAARIAVGRGRGVLSRSPTGCAWTSPMMSRCASRTRRSISRCSSKAEERCARADRVSADRQDGDCPNFCV